MVVVLYLFDVFTPDMQTQVSLLSLDLESGLKAQSGGSFSKQIFWITSLLSSIVLCHKEKIPVVYKPKLALVTMLLFIVIFLSVLWSDYPETTFKRACFQLIFLSTLYFSSLLLKTRENLFETLYFTFCVVLISEVFFLLFLSQFSFVYSGEFKGIHYSKNAMGVAAFLGFIISLDRYYRLKISKRFPKLRITLAVTLLWAGVLILSQSKTCLLLTGMVTLAYVSKHHAIILFTLARKLARGFNLVLFLLLTAGFAFFNDFSYIFSIIFSSVDLTGRGVIWGVALESIKLSPILGSGYGAFWGVGKVPELFDVQFSFLPFINQAHNGYIDVCLQIGVLGLITFMYLIYSVSSALKCVKNSKHVLWSLFVFTLLHNITESSFLRDTAFSWFILIVVVLGLNLKSSELKK